MILTHLLDYEEPNLYNQIKDFTFLADEVICEISYFLKCLCENIGDKTIQDDTDQSFAVEFKTQLVSLLKNKRRMTMSRRHVILDVNDQVSEDSKVEVVAMSPIFSALDVKSNHSSKINSPSKALENFEQECDNYEKLINDLKALQPTVANAKKELSLILKRVSRETFETVSSLLNVDHIINNHITNIYKIQRQNYK